MGETGRRRRKGPALPQSVRGAPEHLKPAIRKKQNSEAAKRSRERRKNKIAAVFDCYHESAATIATLKARVAQLTRLIEDTGIAVPPPNAADASHTTTVRNEFSDGTLLTRKEESLILANVSSTDEEMDPVADDVSLEPDVTDELPVQLNIPVGNDVPNGPVLETPMPAAEGVVADAGAFSEYAATELGVHDKAPNPDQLFDEIMSVLSEDNANRERKGSVGELPVHRPNCYVESVQPAVNTTL